MTDDDAQDLLELISATGRWRGLQGAGMHTYPGSDAQRVIHAECVELERRGLIERAAPDEAGSVFWIPRKT